MIKVEGLTQGYQRKIVLDNVSVHLKKNERCALVGRNGSGKSTLIHTILNLLPYKDGSITLQGHNHKSHSWKKHVSYLPEKFHLYQHLTGWENMMFFASVIGKADEKRIEEQIRNVSLWNDRNALINSYSKGMLQRLGLAIMLYYDTEIIILDEPTSGLDPIGRKEILSIIKELNNKTVLMASHHLEEVKQVCTHIIFIDNHKLTKYTVEEFIEQYEEIYV